MFEDILNSIGSVEDLQKSGHNTSKSKEIWSRFVKVYPTRQEAIDAANADAIKKQKHLTYTDDRPRKEIQNKAIEKYVDDLIRGRMNG